MATYDVGDRVQLTATLTDDDGVLTDPTAVTVTIRKPDGTASSSTPTKDSTGVYSKDVDIDQHGNWFYRFAGTGALVVAEEGEFYVRPRKA